MVKVVFQLPLYNIYNDEIFYALPVVCHATYIRNDMGQKCEGNYGLWAPNEVIKKIYPENLKKIMGALWELPAR